MKEFQHQGYENSVTRTLIEIASEIHDEEDLEIIIDGINHPPNPECSSIALLDSNSRFDILDNEFTQPNVNNLDLTDEVELPFESASVQKDFMQDSYLDEISQPLPEGTRIFSPSTAASSLSENLDCCLQSSDKWRAQVS